ncbi:hypothetical protein [Nostoc sp.]|uniref:hypothetical protein n=1 Tax=Nostoc sp. TaxID=1180 RepID=UPI002FFBEE7E
MVITVICSSHRLFLRGNLACGWALSFGTAPHYEQWFGLLSGGRSQNISISDKSNYFNMTLYTGRCLILPITLRMYKSINTREITEYMNRFKSILLGGLQHFRQL